MNVMPLELHHKGAPETIHLYKESFIERMHKLTEIRVYNKVKYDLKYSCAIPWEPN